MVSDKPRIGITGPDQGGYGAWLFTSISIELAGGKPVRLTPSLDSKTSMKYLDGLIIGGGADVEPSQYGELPELKMEKATNSDHSTWIFLLNILFFPIYLLVRIIQSTKVSPIDPRRDAFELRLLNEAIHDKKPVLGICRGMQLINIHLGGNLHQNISGFYGEIDQVSTLLPRKEIRIEDSSVIHSILGTTLTKVNALHNQAIRNLGENLQITVRERFTDIVQGIEHTSYPFLLGVQWHPEYLIQVTNQRKIFKRLVEQAGRHTI